MTFIKFTNRMINDMSFLLEEALDGLKKVKELQELRADVKRWNKLTRQQQMTSAGEMSSNERQVFTQFTSPILVLLFIKINLNSYEIEHRILTISI